jgi:hypothetical protein
MLCLDAGWRFQSRAKVKPVKKGNGAGSGDALRSPEDVATFLGVGLTKRMKPAEVAALKKALPGYVNVLDDAAEQYDKDAKVLAIKGVSAAELLAIKATQKALAEREAVAEAVYRSIYEQRLAADDRGIDMLRKIARRVGALAEDDPTLPIRWKSVLDFLAQFQGGGRPSTPDPAEQGK